MTRRLILGLLAAHLAIAHLDRQILSFGLPGIREHFELSDLQLGLLGGVAFGLFFGLASVPLSLMIGRFNRKFVLSISISLWSLLTLMGELALGFWHLFVSRVGVGAAEAAAIPAAQSIVADRFEDKHRATAMSIYAAGANIGVAIALIGGGLLIQSFGWRVGFIVAGVPGLLFALFLSLRFPSFPPEKPLGNGTSSLRQLVEVLSMIWSHRDLRYMTFGCILISMTVYSGTVWVPAFLTRIHGLELVQVGLFLALVVGLFGAATTIGLTKFADRLSQRRAIAYYAVPAAAILISKPLAMIGFTASTTQAALILMALAGTVGAIHYPVTLSLLHTQARDAQRPLVAAVLISLTNLIGMGLGPLFTGALSTYLDAEGNSLGTSIAVTQGFSILGALFFLYAGYFNRLR